MHDLLNTTKQHYLVWTVARFKCDHSILPDTAVCYPLQNPVLQSMMGTVFMERALLWTNCPRMTNIFAIVTEITWAQDVNSLCCLNAGRLNEIMKNDQIKYNIYYSIINYWAIIANITLLLLKIITRRSESAYMGFLKQFPIEMHFHGENKVWSLSIFINIWFITFPYNH